MRKNWIWKIILNGLEVKGSSDLPSGQEALFSLTNCDPRTMIVVWFQKQILIYYNKSNTVVQLSERVENCRADFFNIFGTKTY